MSEDLLGTARRLAKASPKKPRQADLKRAVSTAYYALFHAFAKNSADMLIGTTGAQRSNKAWVQTYRALDHGFARKACEQVRNLGFPPLVCTSADAFIELQQLRHSSDYDPTFRISRAEAVGAIKLAEESTRILRGAETKDRRAFAVQLLLKRREGPR